MLKSLGGPQQDLGDRSGCVVLCHLPDPRPHRNVIKTTHHGGVKSLHVGGEVEVRKKIGGWVARGWSDVDLALHSPPRGTSSFVLSYVVTLLTAFSLLQVK